ncbi:hypothetical protein [Thaumasiovibrio subtropicus]|uniref:hypothetical protein n=1 Tax=Thaumasiovibrio subtropicus TaxID=1891207 RepID=UPI000B35D58D|nr:hypothetical protein [Thaumasiovibrio subtropicus]
MNVSKSFIALAFCATCTMAVGTQPIISGIDVVETKDSFLSILNVTAAPVELEIYGEQVIVDADSGTFYPCLGYNELAIDFVAQEHDYFVVPCSSEIIIGDEKK